MKFFCVSLLLCFVTYNLCAQVEFPELILENDDLELSSDYTVSYWDELISPEDAEINEIQNVESTVVAEDLGHIFSLKFFENIALDGFDDSGDTWFKCESGYLIRFGVEESYLIGEFYREDNPNAKLIALSTFHSGMNYDDWSNQSFPTFYKDEAYQTGNYPDWAYQILSSTSRFYGSGELEGLTIELTHAPSNLYYGFQIGEGANNATLGQGAGGWMTFEAYTDSLVYEQQGQFGSFQSDFIFEFETVDVNLVLRHYTITDSDQNTYTQDQFVIMEDGDLNLGCLNPEACNFQGFDSNLIHTEAFCFEFDECGICGGDGNCPEVNCIGDFNNDGDRGSADLTILLNEYGCMEDCNVDLDANGICNAKDLSDFLMFFGQTCD